MQLRLRAARRPAANVPAIAARSARLAHCVAAPCAAPRAAASVRLGSPSARLALRSKIMRFMARLEAAEPEDGDRVFVIKVFLADDTIAVFEPPQKNSGLVGGKFLERGIVKNAETGGRFTGKDFYTGARVRLNGFEFIIYQVRAGAAQAAPRDRRGQCAACTRLPPAAATSVLPASAINHPGCLLASAAAPAAPPRLCARRRTSSR